MVFGLRGERNGRPARLCEQPGTAVPSFPSKTEARRWPSPSGARRWRSTWARAR